jgi:hypothetical protein
MDATDSHYKLLNMKINITVSIDGEEGGERRREREKREQ